ncbi:MAG: rlpA [Rhodospirillales bacterium]|nr:rlpA [Rhodospirillales bacterium]
MTLQGMMVVAGCCLFALTVSAQAEDSAAAKRAAATQGVEKSKVKKRAKSRSHGGKAEAAAANRPAHKKAKGARETGIASWYGGKQQGKRTANGEVFDKYELTAAHRTLPLESTVRVTNTANGRSVTVRVTDRGPATKGRIIDLSQSAAEEIGMKHAGTARVKLETLPASAKSNP